MTTTSLSLIDRVEERLAALWLQMDHIGNARFQEEIEQVSHAFPAAEGSPCALRIIRQAHDLFERVHNPVRPGDSESDRTPGRRVPPLQTAWA